MTAITFPLKKFPGQIKHENIGFTGRISSQLILIVFALFFHLSLAIIYSVDSFVALISLSPILYIIAVFWIYSNSFNKRDSDYFELSYKMFVETFGKDRDYFEKMLGFGFIFSISIWIISLIFSTPFLSKLVVNSILLATFISRTMIEGIYTQKKLFNTILGMIMVEVFFWSIIDNYPILEWIIAFILTGIYYHTIRKIKLYEPIQLLQKIIT